MTALARVAAGAQEGAAGGSPPRHGDKAGQDALQRLMVSVYRDLVFHHRRIPFALGGIVVRCREVWIWGKQKSSKILILLAGISHFGGSSSTPLPKVYAVMKRIYSAASVMRRTRVIRARSTAGLTGLLTTVTSRPSAAARTSCVRSAVMRIAGTVAPKLAQLADDIEAGFPVEVVVRQHQVGARAPCRIHARRACRGLDAATPAHEQQAHAFEDAGVIVDAQHREPLERRGSGRSWPRLALSAASSADADIGRMTEKQVPLPRPE